MFTPRLPFVPRPQAGESPLSVLRRGALGNGHHSTLRFAFSLNPALDHAITGLGTLARSPELFRDTCRAMGLPDEDIARVAYGRVGAAREDDILWNGLRVAVGDLQFRRAKLCMACYLEDGFAHSEWDHVATTACARHHVLLDDACPCCFRPWSPVRDPLLCGCDPQEMIRRQRPCKPVSASLMRRLMDAGNEAGIRLLGVGWSVLRWWQSLGMTINRGFASDALADIHDGRWPRPPQTGANTTSTRLHPRVALAPMLASRDSRHGKHAEALLMTSAPILSASDVASKTWPASTAMAVLGIGRGPFEKLVAAGHLQTETRDDFPVEAINTLLWAIAPTGIGPVIPDAWIRMRSGRRPRSMASMVSEIRTDGPRPVRSSTDSVGVNGEIGPSSRHDLRPQSETVTLSAAAARLRTNIESVRGAIRVGLLDASKGTTCSPVAWVIDSASLDRFDRDLVFASAIAADHGASRTTLASRLQSAGLRPTSGPGIDGGVTYVFRRCDINSLNISEVLKQAYHSPAGRRKRTDQPEMTTVLSRQHAETVLDLVGDDMRRVVAAGWIEPISRIAKPWRFDSEKVIALKKRLQNDYREVRSVVESTGQTACEFRRTWIDTGFVKVRRFGGRELLATADVERIEEAWRDAATSTAIGKALNRPRWLCTNLQKMDQLRPAQILGSGTKKVTLYPRNAMLLARYDMT